jgi:plasmid stabilization system protein ParE
MVTIFWTTQAEEALKDIFDYIAKKPQIEQLDT